MKTLLVVDDCTDYLAFMNHFLVSLGYKVVIATSKSNALAMFPHIGHVDCLITDYRMFGGTGEELVAELGASVPEVRILVSGMSFLHTKDIFSAYLLKPINLTTLADTLNKFLF